MPIYNSDLNRIYINCTLFLQKIQTHVKYSKPVDDINKINIKLLDKYIKYCIFDKNVGNVYSIFNNSLIVIKKNFCLCSKCKIGELIFIKNNGENYILPISDYCVQLNENDFDITNNLTKFFNLQIGKDYDTKLDCYSSNYWCNCCFSNTSFGNTCLEEHEHKYFTERLIEIDGTQMVELYCHGSPQDKEIVIYNNAVLHNSYFNKNSPLYIRLEEYTLHSEYTLSEEELNFDWL